MYYKLAFRNVRKSLRDYLLYFLTLTFAVCIFYVFNSIEAQEVMLKISTSEKEILKTLTQFIDYISIFVSVILGFLIVSANHFLIRRRKKELGIYLLLGMKKSRVSRILVIETLFIGAISLGAGLLTGIFLSQWMSIFTAKIFEADMTAYQFVFSVSAFLKTLIYFGLIFVVVILASTFAVSRNKLIDLFSAQNKNEKPAVRHPVFTVILFILSIACLGVAYQQVLKYGIMDFDYKLLREIILGAVGTFLFFASLSGFFLKLLQRFKGIYYKDLNFFILRQINSRINSAHISISFVCLMLFCTIGILSTGLGMNRAMENSLTAATAFDVEVEMNTPGGSTMSISDDLASKGIALSDYTKKSYEYADYTNPSILGTEILTSDVYDKLKKEYFMGGREYPVPFIRLSDYNTLLGMKGKPSLVLNEGQIAFSYSAAAQGFRDVVQEKWNRTGRISLLGKEYAVYPKMLSESVVSIGADSSLAIIVPDSFLVDSTGKVTDGFAASGSYLQFNCTGDSKTVQDEFEKRVESFYGEDASSVEYFIVTRNIITASYAGTKAIIAYVGIYIGLVFLLTSAAVLSLQQLSEISDNRQRYLVLKKIGADDHLIDRTILRQTAIYFLLPLLLAVVHSIVGLRVANDAIRSLGGINAAQNILITAALILVIYGAYFLATFIGSRQMIVREERNE